jgi:glycosyltransferase involved in cell wall biosynthesis
VNSTNAIVAIPVKNNLHYTEPLVVSLLSQNEVSPHNVLIYDNGSDDETRPVMESLGVQVIDAAGLAPPSNVERRTFPQLRITSSNSQQ